MDRAGNRSKRNRLGLQNAILKRIREDSLEGEKKLGNIDDNFEYSANSREKIVSRRPFSRMKLERSKSKETRALDKRIRILREGRGVALLA